MELRHIDIGNLSVSTANIRVKGKSPDLANILPSIRARGILVPLIVRAKSCPEPVDGGTPDTYEIVAGMPRVALRKPQPSMRLTRWSLIGTTAAQSNATPGARR